MPRIVRLTIGSIPALAGEPGHLDAGSLVLAVYPRACGGTAVAVDDGDDIGGLSPRLRGNPGVAPGHISRRRSIPALAGEPGIKYPPVCGTRVYPRACGGTEICALERIVREGLSPRLRGNRYIIGGTQCPLRSIPALAGEPRRGVGEDAQSQVYPRACGGTPPRRHTGKCALGLSPRLRGNRGGHQPSGHG